MKRRRVIFILPIVSLIVLSLNICSFAMNTGFSTSEPDEKKQQDFLSGNAISLTYEEPKKYIISCFDVSESGLVAVGSATYGNQYIYVYWLPENFNMDMLLIIRGLTACNGTVLI